MGRIGALAHASAIARRRSDAHDAPSCSGLAMDGSPNARRRQRPALADEPPLATGRLVDGSLPGGIGAIVGEAAARIDDWTPKGIHFGWETAFRNKGKFPATMSKADARALVQSVLREAPLQVFPNHREGRAADGEWRLLTDTGTVVGTRGQRFLRIVIARNRLRGRQRLSGARHLSRVPVHPDCGRSMRSCCDHLFPGCRGPLTP